VVFLDFSTSFHPEKELTNNRLKTLQYVYLIQYLDYNSISQKKMLRMGRMIGIRPAGSVTFRIVRNLCAAPDMKPNGEDSTDLRVTILRHALKRVPELGWTQDTLVQGAVDAGASPLASGALFSRGPVELVEYFVAVKNDYVRNSIRQEMADTSKMGDETARTRSKIDGVDNIGSDREKESVVNSHSGSDGDIEGVGICTDTDKRDVSGNNMMDPDAQLQRALQLHIEFLAPHRPHLKEMLSLVLLTTDASRPLAQLQLLHSTVEDLAGYALAGAEQAAMAQVQNERDEYQQPPQHPVRIDWYTDRASLAALYGAVELHLLTDDSSAAEDTLAFAGRAVTFRREICSTDKNILSSSPAFLGQWAMAAATTAMGSAQEFAKDGPLEAFMRSRQDNHREEPTKKS
jgi:ubiquinone biosynthesis protein COQ9